MTAPDHAAIVREALALVEWGDVMMDSDPFAALDALVAERDEALRVSKSVQRTLTQFVAQAEAAEARVAELGKALEAVAAKQPETLAMIEANGFVFDSIGNEPGNWQHLAFSIYTDLCEVDSIARAALAKEDTDES